MPLQGTGMAMIMTRADDPGYDGTAPLGLEACMLLGSDYAGAGRSSRFIVPEFMIHRVRDDTRPTC